MNFRKIKSNFAILLSILIWINNLVIRWKLLKRSKVNIVKLIDLRWSKLNVTVYCLNRIVANFYHLLCKIRCAGNHVRNKIILELSWLWPINRVVNSLLYNSNFNNSLTYKILNLCLVCAVVYTLIKLGLYHLVIFHVHCVL